MSDQQPNGFQPPDLPQLLPDNVREAVEKIPEDSRGTIEKFIFAIYRQNMSLSETGDEISDDVINNTILYKNKEIDYKQKWAEMHYSDRKHSRNSGLIAIGIVIAFLVFVIIFLKDIPDLLKSIIQLIVGLATGFLGGWAFGKESTKSKPDD